LHSFTRETVTHLDGRVVGKDELGTPLAREDALAELGTGLVHTKPLEVADRERSVGGGRDRSGARSESGRGWRVARDALAVPLIVDGASVAGNTCRRTSPVVTC